MKNIGFLVLFSSMVIQNVFGQIPGQKLISMDLSNMTTMQALDKINNLDPIKLSYNPDDISREQKINKTYHETPVSTVLTEVLGNDFELKFRGSYIIIQRKKVEPKKSKFKIEGNVKDAKTGLIIPDATIYEVNSLDATLTNNDGSFELSASTRKEYATFSISRENYMDTLIQVKNPDDIHKALVLRPVEIETVEKPKKFEIETKKLVQFFTTKSSRRNARNVNMDEHRTFQMSFVPMVGTNGGLSGQVTNEYSLNLLAGYAYGLKGIEIGGLYNIVRKDVNGFQIGGFGNAVGDSTRGIQLAGFLNTNKGYTSGFQVAGFVNVVGDEIKGTQLAGFVNVSESTRGMQMAGFVNVSPKDVNGTQLSGFGNYARNVSGVQGSGFLNISKSISGLQLAGGMNLARNAKGMQLATINFADTLQKSLALGVVNVSTREASGYQLSGVNYSKKMRGVQTGLINIAGELSGTQLGGVINISHKVRGLQLGLINIADTVERGVSIGLLNFIKSGKVEFGLEYTDAMDVNATFRSGTDGFYTVLTTGKQMSGDELWSYGAGLGTQFRLFNKFYSNIELVTNAINPDNELSDTFNLLNRFNVNFAYRVAKHFSINAGPVLNIYLTRVFNEETLTYGNDFGQDAFYSGMDGDLNISMWFGYAASLRF